MLGLWKRLRDCGHMTNLIQHFPHGVHSLLGAASCAITFGLCYEFLQQSLFDLDCICHSGSSKWQVIAAHCTTSLTIRSCDQASYSKSHRCIRVVLKHSPSAYSSMLLGTSKWQHRRTSKHTQPLRSFTRQEAPACRFCSRFSSLTLATY